MNVIFLGTNGWYDTETGNTVSVLIETEGQYIILDAGFGFYKVKEYIKSDKPVSLFVSHLHLDHIIGLHTLPLLNLKRGIDIYVPKGMERPLRSLLKRPFTSSPLLIPTKLRYHEISDKQKYFTFFQSARLCHSVPCYGYRLNLDGAIITYCTDTGLCANLKRLADKADLFIAECAMAPDEKGPNLFHLTPQTAAKVAAESGARRLALSHFDPAKYPTLSHRENAERIAKRSFAETIAAVDGTTIVL
ncbi:MAG: hypothetical protein A2987_02915 [Omnitrophica bacterium RIFCSPLOWO2_01_FULL_45_10]|nr:MAG: hypothetical protein A2987_02915 [Omnitrophica bacterium RIFCSPLOWO2_01_FULL_45_10]